MLSISRPGRPSGKSAARRRAQRLKCLYHPLRVNADFSSHFKLILALQSSQQKYSALDSPQISGFIALSRLIEEGRTRGHERGSGMRWTRVRQQTTDARADGQAVWSWRPDAGAKLSGTIR
jgi:hypothetical protein